jgi:thiazolinyl imide reductase
MNSHKQKLLLCGTNYGASYIPAIDHPESHFELAGILAKGSERSVGLAAHRKVPLWSSASEVPDGIHAAVVALPPVTAEIVAKQFIRRKVHVLVEHPITSDVLRVAREEALAANVIHNVNCHFAELSEPRAFVRECRRRSELGRLRYASVVTSPRSTYTTFDVLGRALGGLSNASVERESGPPIEYPFTSFRGSINGIPVRIQCSKAVVESIDDGSDSPVPLRIEIGFENGNLMMLSPAGPVVWSEHLRLALRDNPNPLWINISEKSLVFAELIKDRLNANKRALDEFHQQIEGGSVPAHQSTPWLTTLADLMQKVRSSNE